MAFDVQTVITAARDRSQWFRRERVSDAVIARFLSEYQNTLITACAKRNRRYLQQSVSIVLSLSSANSPSVAGAGTTGGLPAVVDDAGSISLSETSAGALVEASAGTTAMSETVVTSATSTTTTITGAGRTVNGDVGKLLRVVAGKGIGQVREVTSNTASVWTHAAWATIPDATSLVDVVSASLATDETLNVVTALPVESSQTGYLVRRTSNGTAYLDYTQPLTTSVESGVPLPSVHAALGGTVRYTDGSTDPLRLTDPDSRFRLFPSPTVYLIGETLHLVGTEDDWADVQSIELHYLPVAPALTRRDDTLLLPDAAKSCVVAQTAAFMAVRVAGMADVSLDPRPLGAIGSAAETAYLSSLTLSSRARTTTIREAW